MDSSELDALHITIILPLGATACGLLAWLGPLRPRSLDKLPPRDHVLRLSDLMLGILLMMTGQILAGSLISSWFGSNGKVSVSDLTVGQFALMQFLAQAGHLPLIVFILWRVSGQPQGLTRFGLRARRFLRDIGIGLVALILALPVVMSVSIVMVVVSHLWVEPPPPVHHQILEVVMGSDARGANIALLISAVIVAPILEELIYRGLVQTALLELDANKHRWCVVLIASSWFTLIHQGAVTWQAMPALFVLSIFLGWLYERTKSLGPSIVLHMGFNAFNFLWILLG